MKDDPRLKPSGHKQAPSESKPSVSAAASGQSDQPTVGAAAFGNAPTEAEPALPHSAASHAKPSAPSTALPIDSTASLLQALAALQLLKPAQLEQVGKELAPRLPDARSVVRELLKRDWLTAYQANHLLQGQRRELAIGPYRVLERIGKGGMGEVFKARHVRMDRLVALKVIARDRLQNQDAVQRFFREARAAAQLAHPNIVVAYDADLAEDRPYFAMEYIQGETLAEAVKKRGPMLPGQACDYILQAALGLQHAHERGLVHRDIKPQNLLLTPQPGSVHRFGLIKILDLGLARFDLLADEEKTDGLTQEGTLMGTPDYLAPEQALDSHTADIRSDIYSLGCTLYFLLAGRPPFPGGTLAQKIVRHQNAKPQPLESLRKDVPSGLADVVNKMTAKSPADRFQTPRDVCAALAPFGPPLPVAGVLPPLREDATLTVGYQPPPGDSRPPRLVASTWKRYRWQAIAVGGGMLALLLLLSWGGWGTSPDAGINPSQPVSKAKVWTAPPKPPPDPPGSAGFVKTFLGHTGSVFWLSFFPNSATRFVSQSEGYPIGSLYVWDVAEIKEQHIRQMASTSGTTVLHFDFAKDRVFYQLHSAFHEQEWGNPKPLRTFTGHRASIRTLDLSPDGRQILTSDGALVLLWDRESQQELKRLQGSAAYFIDMERAVLVRSKTVEVWDLSKEAMLRSYQSPKGNINHLRPFPDRSRFLASTVDARLAVYNIEASGEPLTWQCHEGYVTCLAISPKGDRAVSGGTDKTVRLWDLATGAELACWRGHDEAVTAVAFSPSGGRAISGSRDKTIRLWQCPK